MMLDISLDPNHPIIIAKGISENGILIMISAFYLVTTATLMIFSGRWLFKVVNGIIDKQEKNLVEIIKIQKETTMLLETINDGLKDKTYQQAISFAECWINTNKYRLYSEAERIKEENNLQNRELIEKKVYSIVHNAYEKRNNAFELFNYRGKKLSDFTDIKWVEKVSNSILDVLYDDNYSLKKMHKQLDIEYDEIFNEFSKNLTR